MLRHQLETEIEIHARPEQVWAVLTDFAAYPKWNPLVRAIRGVAEPGTQLEVRLQSGNGKSMTVRPLVIAVDVARELRWRGRLFFPGLFDGEHSFVIETLPDGRALFRHSKRFSGVLVPMFRSSLDRDTKRGFEAMNRAIKARAEMRGGLNGDSQSARQSVRPVSVLEYDVQRVNDSRDEAEQGQQYVQPEVPL